MLLSPQKIKFFKSFARRSKESLNSAPLKFILGDYALRALEISNLSGRQLEATRKTLRRALRKDAKIWVSAFPNVPMTKKPQEVRMGRGKGNVKQWLFRAKKGGLLFEIKSLTTEKAKRALEACRVKLPLKSRAVQRF